MTPRGAKSIYLSQFLKVARTPHFNLLEFLRIGARMLRPSVQRADLRVPIAIKMVEFTRNGEEPVSSHSMYQNITPKDEDLIDSALKSPSKGLGSVFL